MNTPTKQNKEILKITKQVTHPYFCSRPLVLSAIILVALNDHVLKQSSLSGWWTGKISDFAGLFFFPFLLYDLCSLRAYRGTRIFLAMVAVTGSTFVSLQFSLPMKRIIMDFFGHFGFQPHITQDPSDLIALVSLVVSCYYFFKVDQSFD
jgi:hypothetical protein